MSLLQYGSESIQMGRILEYRTTSMLTPDGIDYICTETRLSFQGVVSFDLADGNVADQAEALCQRLRVPRQPLKLYLGTNESDSSLLMLESDAPDLRGGPFCDDASFRQFSGSRTVYITASFRIASHLCSDPPGVMTNRWSMTHTLDDAYYTEQVISGELTINPQKVICADDVRDSCFKQIPRGMQFVRGTFTQAADGLTLNYSIVFKEKYQLPPGPATDVRANYREETNTGGVVIASMSVDVSGPRSATKSDLMKIAAKITLSRFNFFRGVGDTNNRDTFLGGHIEEAMHENHVGLFTRAQKAASITSDDMPAFFDNNIFGRPYPDDAYPDVANKDCKATEVPIWGIVGENQSGIRASFAAWKDACTEAGQPVQESPSNPSNAICGDIPAFAFAYQPPQFAPKPDKLSQQQRENPYDVFEVVVNRRSTTGLYALPLAEPDLTNDQYPEGVTTNTRRPRTTEMVRLHAPTTRKEIRFAIRRSGAWPSIPKPRVQDGETLVKFDYEFTAPQVGADGVTPLYSATGYIVIDGHTNSDWNQDTMFIGKTPITTFTNLDEGKLEPGKFDDALLYPETP